MKRKILIIWAPLSVATWAAGFIWKTLDPDNIYALPLYFTGWISGLFALGYYCTPTETLTGKITFACASVMITGVVMKIFHYDYANGVIVAGLAGVIATYIVPWLTRFR